VLTDAAPAARLATKSGSGWQLSLGPAQLEMSAVSQMRSEDPWGGRVQITVIAASSIGLTAGGSYGGRSHSLWFGDVQQEGDFAWFESAFMHSPLLARSARQEPFALAPGVESAEALGPGMGAYQVAWPFTQLVIGHLDDFVDRWADWFAQAAQGALSHPSRMPEGEPAGSWRR
jgi:serine/threonine-protein kinase